MMGDPRVKGLVEWGSGREGKPYTLDISPTDLCNLNCRSCWMRDPQFGENFPSGYQLSDKRMLSLVDEAAELGVQHIEITGGGEPLMRKKIVLEMMARIKEHRMRGSLTTNGTLFDEESVQAIVDMHWDTIVFSIDAPDAETNDWLRPHKAKASGQSTFMKILAALEMFRQAKNEADVHLPRIAFNTVLSKKNAHLLAEMMSFAAGMGVHAVNIEPLTIHSEMGEELRLSDDDTRNLQLQIDGAQRAAEQLRVYTNVARFAESQLVTKKNEMPDVYAADTAGADGTAKEDGFLSIPCYEPWYHLVVKTDGSVGPCCVFEDKAVNVKDSSLRHIWTGEFMGHVRSTLESRNFLKWCKICNAGQVLQNRSLHYELKQALDGDHTG